jgi:hypothetical protein
MTRVVGVFVRFQKGEGGCRRREAALRITLPGAFIKIMSHYDGATSG